MSPRSTGARLEDVLQAAEYAGVIAARGRSSFDADVILRLAGERVIEMLAEAVNAAADEFARRTPTTHGMSPSACAICWPTSTGVRTRT